MSWRSGVERFVNGRRVLIVRVSERIMLNMVSIVDESVW